MLRECDYSQALLEQVNEIDFEILAEKIIQLSK